MKTGIITGIVLIAATTILLACKPSGKKEVNQNVLSTIDKSIPDSAVGFGYKCVWFALKTTNKNRIAELLKLKNLENCNWGIGIDKAYEGNVFITPTIDGWTLVCGLGLPHADSKNNINKIAGILQKMSAEFGEAQYFCTHRVVECHCWMRAKNGIIERIYSYIGESGENIVVTGEPTEIEKPYNFINTLSEEAKDVNYFDREDIVRVNEEMVMRVAGNWSVNPSQLDERTDISPSLGLLGKR